MTTRVKFEFVFERYVQVLEGESLEASDCEANETTGNRAAPDYVRLSQASPYSAYASKLYDKLRPTNQVALVKREQNESCIQVERRHGRRLLWIGWEGGGEEGARDARDAPIS